MPTGNSVNAFNSLEMCACALPCLHSLVEMDIHSCQCTLSFTLRHTHARVYGTTSLATVHMHEPMYSQSEALTNHATLVSLRTEHLPSELGLQTGATLSGCLRSSRRPKTSVSLRTELPPLH